MTTYTTPVTVTGTDTYEILADDILDVSDDDAITWEGTDTDVTVTNNGIITDSADNSFTVDADVTGTLLFTNSLNATIAAEFDVRDLQAGGSITFVNNGLINTTSNNAMRLATDGGSVTLNNAATGIIMTSEAGKDAIKDGSNSTINNHGKIIAANDLLLSSGEPDEELSGGDGIDFGDGTNNKVHNYSGAIIEGSKHGITGDVGITVVNEKGGMITGRNGSGLNFDNGVDEDNGVTLEDLADRILTVTNRGTILGESRTYADSDGDAIDTDGLLSLKNSGFIGGMGANGEHDGGTNHSEAIATGGGTIVNYAGGTIYSVERAIQVDDSAEDGAPAAVTITNAGLIQAADGEAINIVGSQADKLTNSGTIIGDIVMGGGNDKVTLKTGSYILGDIMLGAGTDTFVGSKDDEAVYGGSGADSLRGGAGTDSLTGGTGADTFVFATGDTASIKNAADTILDFNGRQGDVLDLSRIDANEGKAGNQAFKFIGDDAFDHKAGEVRVITGKSDTYISGDTDGDGKADFMIHLDGVVNLKADYFDL